MRISNPIAFILILTFCSCGKDETDQKERFINDLISKMTSMEKIGQLNQYSSFFDVTGPKPTRMEDSIKYEQIKSGLVGSVLNVTGVRDVKAMQKLAIENSRLKIPLIFALDVIHGYRTISPIPLAESASWNLDLIEGSAAMAAKEAASAGLNWTFAPMVDISRDARWGRVMEGAGEDPYLGSKIAVARINGFQGQDLKDSLTIAACAKHFAAYGFAESGKDYNTVDIGLQTLHNIVLPPFKASAKAEVATFMNSFNEINGIPATGSIFLQREILKKKWNYDGFVVSDWGSIAEMIPHGFSKDLKGATKSAIKAGSDMDMMSSAYINHLKSLIDEDKTIINLVNDAVKRILSVKYDLGLFSNPYRYCNEMRESKNIYNDENKSISLSIAQESIVLLKNDAKILPLKKRGLKIALLGELAVDKDSPLGNWRAKGKKNSAISVKEGLIKYSNNFLHYQSGPRLFNDPKYKNGHLNINTKDTLGMQNALKLASESDYVITVLGEHGLQSGEGRSRSNIKLPGLQEHFLKEIYKVNKNIILIVMNGRPLDLSWADAHIPAIVESWHLGTMSGNAIASILYGDCNPSGKLPMSFPRSIGQVPIYYNHKNTGRPGPSDYVFWSHYSDEKNDPLYPFGFGLSYTNFEYSNLELSKTDETTINVKFKVKNVGNHSGKEVVQIYVRDRFSSQTRPVKELKRFRKAQFQIDEEKIFNFVLNKNDLGFLNDSGNLVFEKGEYEIIVGGSSKTNISSFIIL